jgi:hypothetical protein
VLAQPGQSFVIRKDAERVERYLPFAFNLFFAFEAILLATALIYVNATLAGPLDIVCGRSSPRAQQHPVSRWRPCRLPQLFVGGWVMPQWFVPPIVIPAGLVALIVAIVLYRHLVGAWNQSDPDPEELLALVAL